MILLLGMSRSKLLMGFWLWRVFVDIPSTHWCFCLPIWMVQSQVKDLRSIKKGLRSLKTLFIRRPGPLPERPTTPSPFIHIMSVDRGLLD